MSGIEDAAAKTEGNRGSNSTTLDEDRFHSPTASSGVSGTDSARIPDSSASLHFSCRDNAAKNWFEKESILKFVTPCSITLVGMNNCGKTTYIRKMLEQADGVFTEAPSRVIYCYNVFQKLFTEMAETVPNICFLPGFTRQSHHRRLGFRRTTFIFDI